MENEESTFLILLRSIFAADSPISELAIDTVVSLGSIIFDSIQSSNPQTIISFRYGII